MAKTKKRAPGLYQKAKQHEAEKLAGGSPHSTRLAARAKRAANDNDVDACLFISNVRFLGISAVGEVDVCDKMMLRNTYK